ncbi:hypothetical protein COCCADRAFT_41485 [Bipolaris zeicola 26-R-13]|uniref:Phospholipase/carboxylesterase/thioesterase domain-containing protein n=1 Tax=Cochliobolus carbonum (strain 26-R-13) TaxID=930089 RepID=W6XL00_COCC2|nr:uncharacterized protein COCCADRAFT_41485 [Bipolaris zeicola 26-R-13]EUC27907.1 hypothetical protein COCCADRAFT_41485 [Bipolaris zeicola 26-R-13]
MSHNANPLSIKVSSEPNGSVPGFLHLPLSTSPTPATTTGVIFLSGAGGGVVKLASLPHPMAALPPRLPLPSTHTALRPRRPRRDAQTPRYIPYISSFVLVGWSFGSAPVFTVASRDARVVGCVGIAPQTAEADGVALLAPRPLLLLHGTGDCTLSHGCSESLELRLFEGDDHALTGCAREAERVVAGFALECAGVGVRGNERGMGEAMVGEEERVELMWKGGDLREGRKRGHFDLSLI